MVTTRTRPGALTSGGALFLFGFVAVSLNSRIAFGQVGPLAPVSGFSSTSVTLLGLLPPLLMGLFAPVTPLLRARLGDDRAMAVAAIICLLGALVRPAGMAGLMVGTAIVAAATAVINVLIPVVVRTHFPSSATGLMMGVYAVCMGCGSAVVAALMVPIAHATGSWQTAIAVAIVPAIAATVGLLPGLRSPAAHTPSTSSTPTPPPSPARRERVHRSPVAWSLLSFFAIPTLLFYAVLAWLPSVVVSHGATPSLAGIIQSLFIVGVGIGGFIAPVLAGRRRDHRRHILAVIGICALGLVGLLLGHGGATAVWAFILGAGLGGGQSLPGVLFAHRGQRPARIAALSTFSQTGGYLIAALGPIGMSAIHSATGSWTWPLVTLVALLAVNAVLSLRAGHDGATTAQSVVRHAIPTPTPTPQASAQPRDTDNVTSSVTSPE